ncbi:hypothetical protein ACHAXS_002367 [Conticribra weissflogii]
MTKNGLENQERLVNARSCLFIHALIVVTLACGFVKFHNSNISASLSRKSKSKSESEYNILQEKYLELSWEKQHVHDIKELLRDDSSTLTTLEDSNTRLAIHLKDMEKKLEAVEKDRSKVEIALRQRRLFEDDGDNAKESRGEGFLMSNVRGKGVTPT